MALSKPFVTKMMETSNVSEQINKINITKYTGSLEEEEIITFCKIEKQKPVSIELIRNMLGGANMEYPAMELENSFECFDFCRSDLITKLQETKFNIEYFEDRGTTDSNIIVSVVKKPKKSGKGEQITLWCIIRMTLFVTPKVGFCRYFDFTGTNIFTVFFLHFIIYQLKMVLN